MSSLYTRWKNSFLKVVYWSWCQTFSDWCIKNDHKNNQEYGKLKKRVPSQVYFKDFVHRYRTIFLKFNFFSQVFFKDFVDRFGTTYLKNGFLWRCFSKILLIDFRIDTNLKTGFSKNYSRKILFVDTKTSTTKIINLKVH